MINLPDHPLFYWPAIILRSVKIDIESNLSELMIPTCVQRLFQFGVQSNPSPKPSSCGDMSLTVLSDWRQIRTEFNAMALCFSSHLILKDSCKNLPMAVLTTRSMPLTHSLTFSFYLYFSVQTLKSSMFLFPFSDLYSFLHSLSVFLLSQQNYILLLCLSQIPVKTLFFS